MQFSIFLFIFAFICVQGKNHVKSLTESMGQEVIEIGSPIRELPPGLEEEPSAEFEDEEKKSTTIVQPATKRETRKSTTVTSSITEQKMTLDGRRANAVTPDDEDRRIEKELAEIYKDTDYKAEPPKEVLKKAVTVKTVKKTVKPISRASANFKFQPNVNDPADVERFRTSIDEISCDKRVTQKLQNEDFSDADANGSARLMNSIAICLGFVMIFVIQ